ncbi:MAG: antitoxin family protein [Nitrospinae bacterium]|nr:antitoxin family protein [Nitrospinota bacterium]
MPKTIEAIYEDGVLKPSEKLDIKEHQKVEIVLRLPIKKNLKKESIKTIIELMKNPISSPPEKMAKASEIDVD